MKSVSAAADTGVGMSKLPQKEPFLQIEDSTDQGRNSSSMNGVVTSPDKSVVSDLNRQAKNVAEDIPDKVKLSPPASKIVIAQREEPLPGGSTRREDVKKIDSSVHRESLNNKKKLHFPQEEYWDFTLEQVTNFDFIKKGGSDYFYYYLQAWFNEAKYFVPQMQIPLFQKSWSRLCYESNCLKGIDPGQIDQSGMRLILKSLSFKNLNIVYNDIQSIEAVFFLQGQLAPQGWDRWFYIKSGSQALPSHIASLKKYLKIAKEKDIRRIAVNLPFQFHKDPVPFIILGEFIKQQKIDLHIVGSCGHYCATYLLPAARTVYIEPYGYIYYSTSSLGLSMDIQKPLQRTRERYIMYFKANWLPDLTDEKKVDFIVKAMRPPLTPPKKLKNIVMNFQGDQGVTFLRQEEEFKKKFKDFQKRFNKLSVTEWTASELKRFVQSFSNELLAEIALLLVLEINNNYNRVLDYFNRVQAFMKMEDDYYSKGIHIKNLEAEASQKEYNYGTLIVLFSLLLKDPEYEKLFSVPRPYYNIPEKDKPYEWVVPSAELLRSVDIDIRGENNIEMLDFSEVSLLSGENKNLKEKILFLDSIAMDSCGFVPGASYDTKKLTECLAESVPEEAHALFQGSYFSSIKGDIESLGKDPAINPVTEREASLEKSPVDGPSAKVDSKGETLPLSDKVLSEDLDFPQGKNWSITLEQMANFDFLKKGGSNLFLYYFQTWFNFLFPALEQLKLDADHEKLLSKFCYEDNCLKGVDLKRITKLEIPSIIRNISFAISLKLSPNEEDINPKAQSVYLLQGQLVPKEWDRWRYIKDKSTTLPLHTVDMKADIYWMKQNNIQRIAVNWPPQLYRDPEPFILLGQFIKQQGIDLHIVGGCGHYCATYLLPAARTVYIEPYGYIYHKGVNRGLLMETKRAVHAQREMYIKQLEEEWPGMTSEDKVHSVVSEIMKENAIMNMERTVKGIMVFLKETDPKKLKEFRDKLSEISFKLDKLLFTDFITEDMRELVKILSPELLKSVALFLRMPPDDKLKDSFEYAEQLSYFFQIEKNYYSSINIQDLPFQKKYDFFGFLTVSSFLLKDSKYADIFFVPKFFYSIPEKDKPYEWIVPSAELLRGLGIDIRGENNVEMIYDPEFLSMLGLSRENILYLDNKGMENCGFFEKDAHGYTTEKIKECLVHE